MRLVQSVRSGELCLVEDIIPEPSPTQVLVKTRASLISAGTERSLRSLASASLLAKARARPDLVKQVIERAKKTGLRSTAKAVRSRLADSMPLGYSAAGVVVSVGEAVTDLRPGQRVATAGAPHADHQIVAGNLTVALPETASFEEGSFSTIASIALNGIRLSNIGPGSRVLVVGLGLVGQITARIALASGAVVGGIEPNADRRKIASKKGISVFPANDQGWEAAADWAHGSGADAVIVTAATKSSDPLLRSAKVARDRALIVLVGESGMNLDRRPFYDKELTLRVARSYGPGRYDPSYEDLGIDYPPGYVPWTVQRNMEAFLNLVEHNRIEISDLITHRFHFTEALEAYELLGSGEKSHLGIVLKYTEEPEKLEPPHTKKTPIRDLDSGLVGTGRFARDVLVPSAIAAGFTFTHYHSATGSILSTEMLASANPSPASEQILESDAVSIVFIATRHDTHSAFVSRALGAGKHVFCEKPLALGEAELMDIESALASSTGSLMVGFNRRWSPSVSDAVKILGSGGPVQIIKGIQY